MITRERLVKYAGFWGDFTGKTVREAKERLVTLPQDLKHAKQAVSALAQVQHEQTEAMLQRSKALTEEIIKKQERAHHAVDARVDSLRASPHPRYANAAAYEAQMRPRVQRYVNRLDEPFEREWQAFREKNRQDMNAADERLYSLHSDDRFLADSIYGLEKARGLARQDAAIYAGVGTMGLAGGAALLLRRAAREAARKRRNLLVGAGTVGLGGLGGLYAYKKRKQK